MPAYNFMKEFIDPILNGSKKQTVRLRRKNRTRPAFPIMLYTGMRTKQCKLIAKSFVTAVKPIKIDPQFCAICIDGVALGPDEVMNFALSDGFEFVKDFFQFFSKHYTQDQLDYDLEVIYWD